MRTDRVIVRAFTCAACGRRFDSVQSDAAARAEYERLFRQPLAAQPVAVVCDDCFERLTALRSIAAFVGGARS